MLFGCASPRTVAAETACEVLVLNRDTVDNIVKLFPILHHQMHEIRSDEKYRGRVLQAMRLKNVGYLEKDKYA